MRTIPTSSEITITMISGALPEPTIQWTLTSSKLETANSVISTASTTKPPVRVRSRGERPGRSGFFGGAGSLGLVVDISLA